MKPVRTPSKLSRHQLQNSQLWWEAFVPFEEQTGFQLAVCAFLNSYRDKEQQILRMKLGVMPKVFESWAMGQTPPPPHRVRVVLLEIHNVWNGWTR